MSEAAPLRRARARRGEGERLRAEIIDAAERLLIETDDRDAVSIRAVAEAVGVSPPSIYLHFRDKDDLLFAVCERHFVKLDEMTQEAAAVHSDPLAELRSRALAYIEFGVRNPEPYRILFMGRPGDAPDEFDFGRLQASASFGHLVDNVGRCMDAGALARRDAFTVAFALWAAVHGVTSLLISLPPLPQQFIDELVPCLLGAVAAGLARLPS